MEAWEFTTSVVSAAVHLEEKRERDNVSMIKWQNYKVCCFLTVNERREYLFEEDILRFTGNIRSFVRLPSSSQLPERLFFVRVARARFDYTSSRVQFWQQWGDRERGCSQPASFFLIPFEGLVIFGPDFLRKFWASLSFSFFPLYKQTVVGAEESWTERRKLA